MNMVMTFVLHPLSHYNSITESCARFLLSLLEHLTIDFPFHFIFSIIDVHLESTSRDKLIFLSTITRTYVFLMLRTYVMILYNWFILWQNALYLYLGRLRMCLNTSRNHISRSSVETFKSVQEIKQKVQFH